MQTLEDFLNGKTVDELSRLLAFVPDEKGGSRKQEIIQRICSGLLGDQGRKLNNQYQQLDKWQQLAVAEALYSSDRCLVISEFVAKYQCKPGLHTDPAKKATYPSYIKPPSRLQLFLINGCIPVDLGPLLKQFVAKPPAFKLPTLQTLPDSKTASDGDEETLQLRLCEQEALIDLPIVHNLLNQGKLKASAKTNRPSAATVNLLAQSLNGGDFYDTTIPKKYKWSPEIGGIKSFAWPLLLQAAKLARVDGSKLELSKSGIKQLSKPAAETLRLLWQKWQSTMLLDEFNRVDVIKGQNSKGRVMTAVAPRRKMVDAALQGCPVGEWVKVDDFFNYVLASKLNFEITHDLWKLYLVDREYGSLGYAGFGDWEIVQGRYVLCLLFEYAATLGMIDVAYVSPNWARDDFRGNWGVDDFEFLSRYDGLRYFRLTNLGAYCLGVKSEYVASVSASECRYSVLPNLRIRLVSGSPSVEDQLLFDTWATQETEDSWKLDKAKTILALERGYDIATLETFLQGKDDQPLPEAVEGFITTCRSQGGAIKLVAVSLLLECSSAEIAETLAKHKESKNLCQLVGKKQLVIKQNQKEKFLQAAHIVGFGMVL